MILAAALLVLVALGLFVAGLVTGVTAFYWTCVGVSAVAAVLLFVARRQLSRGPAEQRRPPARAEPAPPAPAGSESGSAESVGPESARTARPVDERPAGREPEPEPTGAGPATDAARRASAPSATPDGGEPPQEEVEVSDLLLVVDMTDDVFVVDEHPRYHLADCRWLSGRETIPLPVDEARTDGFSPCGLCCPDRHLAQVARARKAAGPS